MKDGVFQVGKKFEAYVNGNLVGTAYIERSAEIIYEKATGTYVERRGRKMPPVTSEAPMRTPSITKTPAFIQKLEKKVFHINERFEFLEKAVAMVASGVQPSVVVSGAGGLGKTYTVKKTLKDFGLNDVSGADAEVDYSKDSSFIMVKGFSTAKNLYRTLYNNNGSVIVLDDIDNILKDNNAVNILKACLDSYDRRIVTWGAEIRSKDDDLPQTFEFTGSIIFITNMNPEKIDQAIRSRSLMIDVSMTIPETIDRMAEIIKVRSFYPEYSMDAKKDALVFIDKMKYKAKELSLRTLITICKIRNEFPSEWEDMAEYVLGE